MDSKTLISLVNSCTKSRAYFRAVRWRGRRHCPWCKHSRKIYRLSNGKFKCSKCRKLFTEFSGTYLSGIKIPINRILYLLHLFVMGVPVFRISRVDKISRYGIGRLFNHFRQAIYDKAEKELRELVLSGKLELDETMFGGHRKGKRGWGAAGKRIVFGMYQRNGKVIFFPIPRRRAKHILPLVDKHTKEGSIYYTDDFRGYVSLVIRGRHIRIRKEKGRPVGKNNINGMEGCWSYAKNWLYHYRGVSRDYFHLYLKEIEFRFNNRDKDLFDELVNILLRR